MHIWFRSCICKPKQTLFMHKTYIALYILKYTSSICEECLERCKICKQGIGEPRHVYALKNVYLSQPFTTQSVGFRIRW